MSKGTFNKIQKTNYMFGYIAFSHYLDGLPIKEV